MQLALEDSRRLTGPNLVSDGPGAVLEVRVEGGSPDALVDAWDTRSKQILAAIGWSGERLYVRAHKTGVSLAISAPIDALYAAIPEDLAAIESALPPARETYYAVFDGHSVRDQLALQAAAERQGSQAWQGLKLADGLSPAHLAELDALTALELASAERIDALLDQIVE